MLLQKPVSGLVIVAAALLELGAGDENNVERSGIFFRREVESVSGRKPWQTVTLAAPASQENGV
jgi:hypothetical protein